ncbi:Ras1 guanine nucleotide exchange factor [Phaffia rhodozyma]|uniref:Ras1 guanine nucleotide exchange factor n=1 Tax=Phaffia rhodozyma TaxID=264483 RepID=A0A0F7SU46_PHARH|nr:Ras1 guanine nucleotide exchange factor [Phaffia rhodozyma]
MATSTFQDSIRSAPGPSRSDTDESSPSNPSGSSSLYSYQHGQTHLTPDPWTISPRSTSPVEQLIFVQAQHHWKPDNPTYLGFRRGQIIRVHNKDPSGWWDGELDSVRGWFPSNYVQAITLNTESRHSEMPIYSSSPKSMSTLPILPPRSSDRRPSRSLDRHVDSAMQNVRHGGIEASISHAIALLHTAATAGRVSHFQPSTACVISSVRSILSSTDCLNKKSSHLKAFPMLARGRRHILANLSKLVAQTRTASGPLESEVDRPEHVIAMLSIARKLHTEIQDFLLAAIKCGIDMPKALMAEATSRKNRLAEAEGESQGGSAEGVDQTLSLTGPTDGRLAIDLDRTPKPHSSGPSGFPGPVSLRSGGLLHTEFDTDRIKRSESDSAKDGQVVAGLGFGERVGSPRSFYQVNQDRFSASLFSSTSNERARVLSQSSALPSVVDHVHLLHDEVVSILAAFIGHIHFHSTTSHPSSHAHILDVARTCLTKVTDLLGLVDTVAAQKEFGANRSLAERRALEHARSDLFESVDSLISSAQKIAALPMTGQPSQGVKGEQGDPSASGDEGEKVEDEVNRRTRLLNEATATARCAGVCRDEVERWVRPFTDTTAGSRMSSSYSHDTEGAEEEEEEEEDEEDRDEEQDTVRHNASGISEVDEDHLRPRMKTLSILMRKALALDKIRRQSEDEDKVGQDFKELHERELTVRPRSTGQQPTEGESEEEGERTIGRGRKTSSMLTASSSSGSGLGSSPSLSPMPLKATLAKMPMGKKELMNRASSTSTTDSLSFSTNTASSGILPTPTRSSIDLQFYDQPLIGTEDSTSEIDEAVHMVTPGSNILSNQTPIPKLIQSAKSRPQSSNSTSTSSVSSANNDEKKPSLSSTTSLSVFPLPNAHRWVATHDYHPTDLAHNSEGHIIGATLPALIEKMTPLETVVDPNLPKIFFLTFRSFTSPQEVVDQLVKRFDIVPPSELVSNELIQWKEARAVPVQLRIYQFLRTWLDTNWRDDSDRVALKKIRLFAEGPLKQALPNYTPRLVRSLEAREQAFSESFAAPTTLEPTGTSGLIGRKTSFPNPIVNRSLMNNLRSPTAVVSITDFDPLELARQLTVAEFKLFSEVKPEDLVKVGTGKGRSMGQGSALTAMSTFSNQVTGFVSETLLNEEDLKKRMALMKFFIKLAARLVDLQNFSASYAVLGALNSASITRLQKTFGALSTKTKNTLARLRELFDVSRNHSNYRTRLRETNPSALPFLGIALTDLTFCQDGNPDTRPSPQAPEKMLINLAKYQGVWRIVSGVQKFQVPYTLVEVPEIQTFLVKVLAEKGSVSLNGLYRKSLRLEPRSSQSDSRPTV